MTWIHVSIGVVFFFLGKWVAKQEQEHKDEYVWHCPDISCEFQASSNDKAIVDEVGVRHMRWHLNG